MHQWNSVRRLGAPRQVLRQLAALAVLTAMAYAAPAAAAIWTYVDETGDVHFASEQIDPRYQLFFKGETAPAQVQEDTTAAAAAGAAAPDTAEAQRLYQRLTKGQNPARFERLIEEHASKQDLDPALIKAIVAVESGFSPVAISPKGARGLMQVMPDTAARYGVVSDKKRSTEQKLLDPAVSLQVGTRYLRDLLARFAGDIALSLAAYNAGEMAVERYKNRVPPFPETVEYVKRVQKLYAAFRPASTAKPSGAGAHQRIHGTFLALEPPAAEASAPSL